jgi:hypothetical protein
MGQNQYHLDVLVLSEIRHALDKAGQNAPTEIVGAAEKGCAEFGPTSLSLPTESTQER